MEPRVSVTHAERRVCSDTLPYATEMMYLMPCPDSRVAELEQENARLLALAQGGGSKVESQHELLSEVEQLRAQLAAAQERASVMTFTSSSEPSPPTPSSSLHHSDDDLLADLVDEPMPPKPVAKKEPPKPAKGKARAPSGTATPAAPRPAPAHRKEEEEERRTEFRAGSRSPFTWCKASTA